MSKFHPVSSIFARRLWLSSLLFFASACSLQFKVPTQTINAATGPVDALPSVSLTAYTGGEIVKAGDPITLTWSCLDSDLGANPVTIEYSMNSGAWTLLAGATANDGSETWVVPTVADGTLYKFRVTVTDLAVQAGTATGADISVDNAAPTLSSFTINGGVSPSVNNSVPIDLTIVDSLSPVTYLCFKETNSAPTSTDPCWTPVNLLGATSATTINLNDGYFALDFVPGAYTLYAWARDSFGFISTLSAAGAGTIGQDRQTITYDPGIPAVVADVVATRSDSPSAPPTISEMTATIGTTVYIKWNITDDDAIPAGSVALYYTTDESTFTLISSGLNNAVNGGCTVTGSQTGCYTWSSGSPVNTYYRVRVGITDSDGLTSFGSGNLLNAGNFRLIAGNTDDGRNGSATAGFFNTEVYNIMADRKSLVVTDNGSMYFKDRYRGILKIDANTKTVSTFIPETGTSSGDGGAATSATLRDVAMISLDYANNLLIWDYDRIRRVNLTTGIISTFIGGGGSTANTVAPLSISLPAITGAAIRTYFYYDTMLFDALPNGDLYFRSENPNTSATLTGTTGGVRIRKYTAATNTITSIYLRGTGAEGNPSRVLATDLYNHGGFAFDPATSAITVFASIISDSSADAGFAGVNFNPTTGLSLGAGPHAPVTISSYSNDSAFLPGRDGKLYQVSGRASFVKLYNSMTNTWTNLNNNGWGYCADNTLFASCPLRLQDVFVSASGRMFLVDNNTIRYVDKNNRIQTIFGQSYYQGNGGQAISARLSDADWVDRRADGRLIFSDRESAQLWEMTVGGTINKIAGNGVLGNVSTIPLAVDSPFNYGIYGNIATFAVDPTNGEVYQLSNNAIFKLDRITNRWTNWMNGGGTSCFSDPTADGSSSIKWTGTSGPVNCANTSMHMVGFNGSELLVTMSSYNGLPENKNPFMKLYDIGTQIQSHLLGGLINGIPGHQAGWCADGTGSSCTNIPTNNRIQRYQWDSGNSRWLMASNDSRTIKAFPQGGVLSTYTQVPASHYIAGYAVRYGAPDIVYYCNGNEVDSRLYRHVVGSGTATVLPFGSASISCTSVTVTWDPVRSVAIFGVTQNGLSAVAEYYDP